MPSTSSPATQSTGKCVVCGKETYLRCSACSENGLDWMFFCSIEHQKLIWFMHKRVCGARAVPFRWPGFDSKETEDMIAFADKPFYLEAQGELTTFFKVQQGIFAEAGKSPLLDSDMIPFFRSHQEPERHEPIDNTLETAANYASPRVLAHRSRIRANHAENPKVQMNQHHVDALIRFPFDAMASRLNDIIGDLLKDARTVPWYTEHLHLYVIHLSTLVRHVKRTGPVDGETLTHVEYTTEKLQQFYLNVIAKTHPGQAQLFIDDLMLNKMSGKVGVSGKVWPMRKIPKVDFSRI